MESSSVSSLSALVLLIATASCATQTATTSQGSTGGTPAGQASPPANCAADNAGLTLPRGFCANVFADSLGRTRYVTVAANGDVYVALEGTRQPPRGQTGPPPQKGAFVALRDTNRDGRADVVEYAGTRGNTGIALNNGYLYVDEGERIVRYRRPEGQLVPATPPEVIVDGIPLNPGHRARNFAIAGDGSLYMNVGSPTNSCQERDRQLESPGKDPCSELETRAGIWKFDANKTNQTFSASARYVTGARNSTGMAFGGNGQLYAMTHGRDNLHENWPKVFPLNTYGQENPAEMMFQPNQGDNFGWPYCYYAVDKLKYVDAPEYGGDGTRDTRCAGVKAPTAIYPAHWAPLDLMFYRGSNFPERYRGGALISFHGSWNRAPGLQAGGKVVFQPVANGVPSGKYEIFADGFAGLPPAEIQPNRAKHRPVGLAVGPDGALYVTDDAGGRVYRITYR